MVYHRILNIFPCAIQQQLPTSCFTRASVYINHSTLSINPSSPSPTMPISCGAEDFRQKE